MALNPESLPEHPDKETVHKIDPESLGYRPLSKWRDRYCGNCGWFAAQQIDNLPDVTGDEHPEADGKGPVHRCALVGGGVAKGGYCAAWGTAKFCDQLQKRHRPIAEIIVDLKKFSD